MCNIIDCEDFCPDEYEEIVLVKDKSRMNNRIQKRKHKAKILKQMNIVRVEEGEMFSTYYPACYSSHYKRRDQHPHIHRFKPRRSKKMLKKLSNRRVRHAVIPLKGNGYKKVDRGISWWAY